MANPFYIPKQKSDFLSDAGQIVNMAATLQNMRISKQEAGMRERVSKAEYGDPTATDPIAQKGLARTRVEQAGERLDIDKVNADLKREQLAQDYNIFTQVPNSDVKASVHSMIDFAEARFGISNASTQLIRNTYDKLAENSPTPVIRAAMHRNKNQLLQPVYDDIGKQRERAKKEGNMDRLQELNQLEQAMKEPGFLHMFFPRLAQAEKRQEEARRHELLTDTDRIPASIQEYKFFKNLSEEEQQAFLNIQRKPQTLNLGDRSIVLGKGGEITQEFKKGLPPQEETIHQAAAAEATQTGKSIAETNAKQYEAASNAVSAIEEIDSLITQIEESEAITGLGAEVFKNIERARTMFGSDVAAGRVAATEILDVMMGKEVFPMIKALGVGARGLDTPAEREFMRKVLTGSIDLNKTTLLKMAKIRRRVQERAIDKWNKRTEAGELDRFYEASGLPKQKFEYRKTNDKRPPLSTFDRR